MKEKIVDLLQQRLNNCTKEQFWAVGTVAAFNAIFILQNSTDLIAKYSCLLISIISFANITGIYYVFSRHKSYYKYRKELTAILKDEKNVPEIFKKEERAGNFKNLWGCIFYISWILFVWLIVIIKIKSA